ncbi:MAG: cytochrome c oxidase subunit 3 family protein [Candidatus Kapaibacterium sp.]
MGTTTVDAHGHSNNHAGHGYGDNDQLYVHFHRDDYGSKFGMWLFLFTEVLLFGGLFVLYYGYRIAYPQDYHNAAMELNIVMGAVNTLVLLTSSLTMVLSIVALRRENIKTSLLYLAITFGFGATFCVNKYFEWSAKIHHGIYPGSLELQETRPAGEVVFFGLYYLMTGLHTFHVIVGMVVMVFCYIFIKTGTINSNKYIVLENAGLYWHLVDLIWIFLFPLFYLLH